MRRLDNVVLRRASTHNTITTARFIGHEGTICFIRPDENLALVMFEAAAMHVEVNITDLEKIS